MSEQDRASVIEQWRAGVVFSIAWLVFADPDAKRRFHDAKLRGGQLGHRLLMVGDLWAGLRDGQFEAFGKCVAPQTSDGPVRLPFHMFEFGPPRGVADGDDIEVSGWRYEGVKIARAISNGSDRVSVAPVAPEHTQSRGGRPDTYGKAAEALKALFENDCDRGLSPQKLHPLFEVEFQRLFPRDTFKVPTPALRTFQNQLKRYRQELAETCNKQFAS